jgi:hypothetical protein
MEASGSRLRALAFYDAIGYPPTDAELSLASAPGPIVSPARLWRGRIAFEGREELIAEQERREAFFPRKIRKARRVARLLSRLPGVRFVALCNTTALANARDEGDLDFFVVTRRGSLALARALATTWYALTGSRPGVRATDRDAVCLSFWVDDSALDLARLQLTDDRNQSSASPLSSVNCKLSTSHNDPYFRFWFLSLIPLFDDGVSADLWKANPAIRSRHPHARAWIPSPDLRVKKPLLRLPRLAFFDPIVRRLQERTFSPILKKIRNTDTRVVITPHVLKFHAEDGRASFRDRYHLTCKRYGLEI